MVGEIRSLTPRGNPARRPRPESTRAAAGEHARHSERLRMTGGEPADRFQDPVQPHLKNKQISCSLKNTGLRLQLLQTPV